MYLITCPVPLPHVSPDVCNQHLSLADGNGSQHIGELGDSYHKNPSNIINRCKIVCRERLFWKKIVQIKAMNSALD